MTTRDVAAVFCADDNYLPHVATPIAALRAHHPDLRVVVITDATGPLPDGVERVATAKPPDPPDWTTTNPRVQHITAMSWQKLYAPQLVDADRVVIFEVDTLALQPVDALLHDSMGSTWIGGVADRFAPTRTAAAHRFGRASPIGYRSFVPEYPYINTGVVVVDVAKWRRYDLTAKAMRIVRDNTLPELEQDAFNSVLQPIHIFDPMLNFIVDYDTRTVPHGCRVLHYTGPVKPWNSDYPPSPSLDAWNQYRPKAS